MSEQAARSWLSSHQDPIPALEIYHRRALEVLEDENKSVHDLADVIALDPGMSVSLFQQVNGRLRQSGKSAVETVHAALGLLGDGAIADLVRQHSLFENLCTDDTQRRSYYQLLSRSYHLQAQLEGFMQIQGISAVQEMRCAGLLHNIGEYLACQFDFKQFQQYEIKHRIMGSEANTAKQVFGFDFQQIGRLFAQHTMLPELIVESLDNEPSKARKPRLIQLAANVSQQAEAGWYHESMKLASDVCANYLSQPTREFEQQLHALALSAAQNSPLSDVLPAAARLIMLPDREPPVLTEKKKPDIKQRLNQMLRSAQTSQVDLIDMLLTHLHEEMQMSRVVLLLLSSDKGKLGTRAVRGIDTSSPINKLVIDTRTSGLLNQMLAKPQGLWMQTQNYARFQAALPDSFKATILQENFMLMSLFISGNPTGMIYCDRSKSTHKIDKASYQQFKSAVHLASIALTQLAKRRQRASPQKLQATNPEDD